jgi:hypothetical protein
MIETMQSHEMLGSAYCQVWLHTKPAKFGVRAGRRLEHRTDQGRAERALPPSSWNTHRGYLPAATYGSNWFRNVRCSEREARASAKARADTSSARRTEHSSGIAQSARSSGTSSRLRASSTTCVASRREVILALAYCLSIHLTIERFRPGPSGAIKASYADGEACATSCAFGLETPRLHIRSRQIVERPS